ncbi:unnamed protein product [Durusdinium trenchii]|uniref:DNA-directed DNA polymerase family B exonuclease domain-containing protein n=1 Tax=Durusdinium trenchii TaxID=1381693 RepID=A0ABP0RVC1_9DINO
MDDIEELYEHDVAYVNRVCIDNKINVGKWYDVTRNLMATSMEDLYDTQCKVTELDMQKKPALRIFAWDIECTKEPLKFPDSARDRITMISIMVDGSGFLIVNRAEVSADIEPLEYTPKPEYEGIFQTYNEEDEAALLKRFFQLMRETCPHVMVSFNGDFFDYPFVINRAKAYNMDWCEEAPLLARCGALAGRVEGERGRRVYLAVAAAMARMPGMRGLRVKQVPGLLRDLYEKRVEGEDVLCGIVIHRRNYPDVTWLSIVEEKGPPIVGHEVCYKAAPRELWRTVKLGDAIEVVGWWSTGHRGVHMDAKRVVVQCMRKWGVTHCIQVRQTLFAPQSQEPAQRPAALRAIRSLPVDAHGPSGSDAVSERAEAVAEFFLKAVPSLLSPSSHVLDVAGGTGLLALALARRGVRCTVVDPRKAAGCLPSRARKLARKTGFNALIRAQRAWFGGRPVGADDSFGGAEDVLPSIGEESELVRNCSGFVALHPDEATEAVVEAALRLQRPFLVVPCCVFARLFPHRRLADGRQVTSLPEFLDFLQSKHPSIRKEQLPFEGANQALWSDGKYCFDLQKSGARQHAEDGNEARWKLLTFASCTCKVQCWKLSFDRFRHAWIEVPLQSLDYETAASNAMLSYAGSENTSGEGLLVLGQVKLHPDFAKIWPLVVRFWYGLPVTVESFETAVELRKIAQYYEADELKSYTSQLIFGATPTAPRMAMLVDSLGSLDRDSELPVVGMMNFRGFEEDLMERAWAYLEAFCLSRNMKNNGTLSLKGYAARWLCRSAPLRPAMAGHNVTLRSATSGATVGAWDFEALVGAQEPWLTVRKLKQTMAMGGGYPRFRQRLLNQTGELLSDDVVLSPPVDLQLVILECLPAETQQDTAFIKACAENHIEEVERMLQWPQNPNATEEQGGYTALHAASQEGMVQSVCLLLEARADVGLTTRGGASPLHLAAMNGQLPVVELLLSSKAALDADRTEDGATPLHAAAHEGHLEVVRLLLREWSDKDMAMSSGATPLHLATQNDHLEVVRLLIQLGADMDRAGGETGTTPLHAAAFKGHLEVTHLLLELQAQVDKARSDDGATALVFAAQNGHLEITRLLLAAGADKDKARTDDGTSPLHAAAYEGHLEIVGLLLQAGADKDKTMTDDGATALHLAAQNGHLEVARLLLESGAQKDKARTDDGTIPLHACAYEGYLELVRLLLQAGSDKDAPMTDDGATPLYLAAQKGQSEVVKLLLEAGAEVNRADDDGMTPLHASASEGQLEVVQVLLNFGACGTRARKDGVTASQLAAENGHLDIAHLLESFQSFKRMRVETLV